MPSPVNGRTCIKDDPPTVWLVMGYRAGENAQILALGEALGWPFEIKRLVHREYHFIVSLPRRISILGIDREKSNPLTPPWPDLVISAGLRNEPVYRWIKQQSGGKTRLVHIGRPWVSFKHLDLVVTTPQYRLPNHPHVLQNKMTLNRVTPDRLAEAAAEWQARIADLPTPYIAVMVGGNSGPYTFDKAAAERLGRKASATASALGGSLLVTTSARTPKASIEALGAAISCPSDFFRWTSNSTANPYFSYLGLADSIIVTGDSIAMLSEACATRKPVYIFDLDQTRSSALSVDDNQPVQRHWWESWELAHGKAFFYKLLMRMGPQRLSRDLRIVYDDLIASGRAMWLGETFPAGVRPPQLEDMPRAVARIRALLEPNTVEQRDQSRNCTADPVR